MKQKWNIEITIDAETGTALTKVTNPDGSWGVIESQVIENQVIMNLVDHSDNLDVNAFKMGMSLASPVAPAGVTLQ
jgi:hypothetical protein